MSKPGLVLIGAGGHAQACIDVIEQQAEFEILGLLGLPEELGQNRLGYRVLGDDKTLSMHRQNCDYALVTLGQIKSSTARRNLYQSALDAGFKLPAIISSSAYVSPHAHVGAGTIIMHGATVNAGANIGENCIINSHSLIEHNTLVEPDCHISTGAILNGDVTVGTGSFIGSGAVIREGIVIGAQCLVGMGEKVKHNLGSHHCFINEPKK
ncbi:MAG: NeuD/PglB/VioB family sugar acetyltransferase [Halioglobus sp.]